MKILLFGCSGFIGKELIPRLIKEKHEKNKQILWKLLKILSRETLIQN